MERERPEDVRGRWPTMLGEQPTVICMILHTAREAEHRTSSPHSKAVVMCKVKDVACMDEPKQH